MEIESKLRNNSYSGIEYARVNFQKLDKEGENVYSLFDSGNDSVKIESIKWGAYDIIKSTAFALERKKTLISLMGHQISNELPALYLADHGRPLNLCGETLIKGNCNLPKIGVKRAYIEGKNYKGAKLVYGSIDIANKTIPNLNLDFDVYNLTANDKWTNYDSLVVSFADETRIIESDAPVVLDNSYMHGNIILVSKDSITIRKSNDLENIIIVSPKVKVESGFIGAIQIFATENITLESEVELIYPSAAVLIEKEFPKENEAAIYLKENTHILGTVILDSMKPNFRIPVHLNLSKSSQISGLVYCKGKTQLRGEVLGHLYTNKFYLRTKAATYENHILDGKVSADLPENFGVSNHFFSTDNLILLKWLL